MRIAFEYWQKPIPIRTYDWCAYDDDKDFPQCYGPTRLTALLALWDQMAEELEGQC